MKAPEVRNPAENVEKTIENMVKVWARTKCTPGQLFDFARYVQRVKQLYRDDRALSDNNALMHIAEIPDSLNSFMIWIFGVEWRNREDVPVMRCFLRVCDKMRINPRSLPPTDHSRVEEDNTGFRVDPEVN